MKRFTNLWRLSWTFSAVLFHPPQNTVSADADKLFSHETGKNHFNDLRSRLIIGGTEAEKGRYPYKVLLKSSGRLSCGGSLIHPQWVLSAAHCSGMFDTVEIGRHDLSDDSEEYEIIGVGFEVIHPNYKLSTNFDYDFMLIYLSERTNYTSFITLDDGSVNLTKGFDVTAMGWGVIDTESKEISDVLMEVELDIVSNKDCEAAYEKSDVVDSITDDMLCASREGKDSCQGDSGGPLIIKGDNATVDIQVGIVSFGLGCALPEYPGVYSRVSFAQDFINASLSCAAPNDIDGNECCKVECVNGEFRCTRAKFSLADGFDYSQCNVPQQCWVGDGLCDIFFHNVPECNYDGGDCCEESCVDGDYACGGLLYVCLDPDYLSLFGSVLAKVWLTMQKLLRVLLRVAVNLLL